MIQNILLKMGLPLLVDTVAKSLDKHPNKQVQDIGKNLQQSLQNADLSKTDMDGLLQQGVDTIDTRTLHTINTTMRSEVASTDGFVRRMRPTFGYIMAFTWGVQMTAVAVAMFTNPDTAPAIISALGELGMMWSIGLSVLGVYVYKRSTEKIGR